MIAMAISMGIETLIAIASQWGIRGRDGYNGRGHWDKEKDVIMIKK